MDENTQAHKFTQIDKGTTIEAQIDTKHSIKIAGNINGDIQSDQKLILTDSGYLKGTFIAENMDISGRVEGEIRVKDKLVIQSTARISGQIFAKQFLVNEGAEINADIHSGIDVKVDSPTSRKNITDSSKTEKEKPSPKETTPPPKRFLAHLLIGIPGTDLDQTVNESIKDASEAFLKSMDYSLEIFDETSEEPYFQNLTFVRKSHDSEQNIEELFQKAKQTLENGFMKKEQSEGEDSERIKAANKLISALSQTEEAAVIIGKIALVQTIEDNVQTVAAEIMQKDLVSKLKNDPKLVLKPAEIYHDLQS